MKPLWTALAATGFAALVALPASADVTLRYAHVGAEGEGQTRFAEELAKRIEERTDGRVQIEVFGNSQLGNLSEMLDAVRVGAIQMAHHDFSSLDRFYEDVAVFNAPYAYRGMDHAMKATAPGSPVLDEINEKLIENASIRIVGNFYRGARHLTARYPVYSPADMAGKKFRGVPIQLWSTMLEGMGAIPTPVEISEIMPALMTGLVEGQENPLNNIIARKMYEANEYLMMTGHMESVLAVFVNEDAWEGIPDEDRAIVEEVLEEVGQESLTWYRDSEADEIAFLKEQGVTVIDESAGLKLDEFREAVRAKVNEDYPNWSDYLKRIDEVQ
ncbi:TRAP transporter substrate-binding protein [Acuticoccus sp. I52.16.1]|uniref:TRAP transporter substrate-binding protein n=1 Tax=Acuticoccus sp. I52.16.1 TaxID=2928472 RepID=UPI001FD02FA8|nr:TRAP transporter substrate-binding protein [Acuticoccus sp. I52.16.1]UOM35757.1 TRAP transporter substrate-binding protein [Acuticoccus sp. I52.16.1]